MADKGGSVLSVLDNFDFDVNEMVKDLTAMLDKLDKDTNAVVYNATDKEVTFKCYFASDILRWVPSRDPKGPAHGIAMLNKADFFPGPTIQVLVVPKDKMAKAKGPFQVLRHHAYIWTGDMFIPAMKLETEGAEGETETAA
jgi:hypothetical protein